MTEARVRAKVAAKYLEVAELAASEDTGDATTVAAGCSVLAAIAASDALCCARLGQRSRAQSHTEAAAMLETVRPGGKQFAMPLRSVLALKVPAHYGSNFVTADALERAMRAVGHLVQATQSL
ncbi:MAG: hypothetical protein ACYDEY_05250 [Acidimicrobiales bacterium]